MKKHILLASLCLAFVSCKKEVVAPVAESVKYVSFGDSISKDGAISKAEMFTKYQSLREGDTIDVSFTSSINDVCQKKGCWMNLALTDKDVAFVKFKDYGFFMPLNSKGSEVIVHGKAFVSVESVEELKHYAKDAGKSQASIDSIVAPEVTYSFEANGVLLKQ
ncbi:MAG: DUF4920 domain-containing protein [Flavobacterium sp.]|nr:DUF4920 domain-containing protein [Flavobacterium sp.]